MAAHARRDPQRVPALLLLQPRGGPADQQAAEQTRGAFLLDQQQRFYDEHGARRTPPRSSAWDRTRAEREATYMAENREAAGAGERDAGDLESGGYEQVALALMRAIARDERTTLILNVRNRGTLWRRSTRTPSSRCPASSTPTAPGRSPVDPLPDHASRPGHRGQGGGARGDRAPPSPAPARRPSRRSRCTRSSTP